METGTKKKDGLKYEMRKQAKIKIQEAKKKSWKGW